MLAKNIINLYPFYVYGAYERIMVLVLLFPGRLWLPRLLGWSFLGLIYGGVCLPLVDPLAFLLGQGFPTYIDHEKMAPPVSHPVMGIVILGVI